MPQPQAHARPLTFDVHTHVGADTGFYLRGWWPYGCTTQDLLQHMRASGIDRAVCFPFTFPSAFDATAFADGGRIELLPDRVPFDRENTLLVQELDRLDPQHQLYPLAIFDPARKVDEQLRLLEPLANRIAGLKTQSTILESPIRSLIDGPGRELMAFAEQYALPVLLHTAVYPQDRWAQVADCLDVAAAWPNVRFDLAHSLRFHAGHLRTAATMPNVWVDCAAHLAACALACDADTPFLASAKDRVDADYRRPADVLTAIHAIMNGRFMWGSDNPFMSWNDGVINVVFSYADEVAVLNQLSGHIRTDMTNTTPQAWLGGRLSCPSSSSEDSQP